MKKSPFISRCLMGTFLLTAASGFVLHRENAAAAHDVWHAWATAHTVAGLLFAFATVLHVRSHRCWFKGFARKACNRNRRTTTMLTLLFAILLVTGLILLPVTGADSSLGRLHFAAGLAAIPHCAVHMAGRSATFRRKRRHTISHRERRASCRTQQTNGPAAA